MLYGTNGNYSTKLEEGAVLPVHTADDEGGVLKPKSSVTCFLCSAKPKMSKFSSYDDNYTEVLMLQVPPLNVCYDKSSLIFATMVSTVLHTASKGMS